MAAQETKSVSSHIASVVSIPGYKIKDLLGRGGMAVVYLATQESIGRDVALKVLTPDHTDESFSERFLREARIVSHLNHPNIVTIYDAGVHQGCHYMTMEYVPGLNLRQARDTLSRKEKVKIIKQVALALDYAGKKGFVHRDIKPENIMMHEDGRAILTDFGIARGLETTIHLTLTGKAIGTPYYMSPEQTKGLKVDPRSDIYSLGVMLFQVLAGFLPYDGTSLVTIGMKHISDPVPDLPKGMDLFQPIINKCMAKEPGDRYQNARELHAALDAISDQQFDEIDRQAEALLMAGMDHDSATVLADSLEEHSPRIPRAQQAARRKKEASQVQVPIQERKTLMASDMPMPPIDITNTADFKRLENRSRVILLFILLLVITLGYFQQKDVLKFWKKELSPYLQQIFADKTDIAIPALPPLPKQTETIEVVTPPPSLQSQVAELQNNLDEQPDNTRQIAQLYQQTLAGDPANQEAEEGLLALQEWFFKKLEDMFENRNFEQSKRYLILFAESIPTIVNDDRYQQLEQDLDQMETVQSHVKMAQIFINTRSLVSPEEANAVKEIQAALTIDPDNTEALELAQEVANIFISRAKQHQAAGKLNEALEAVQSGLMASAKNETLLALQDTLTEQIHTDKTIKDLLSKAKRLLNAGNLFSPRNNNAYDTYRAVLGKQKNNPEAESGLATIVQIVAQQSQQAINNHEFAAARRILDEADGYFRNSPVLIEAQKTLAQAMDATLPKITRIIFSDREMDSFPALQANIIQPGRTLYVGFEYKNFSGETTLVQANLLDGSGRVTIAQKPVIVNGSTGQHFFYVELPVEGFADGTYNLELMMKHTSLVKAPFQVKNQIRE